ncbi:MAG: peptide chain release factor 3 [Elusimicrobia bacterium]|nr:peptide chain release factor 3 [Elusimicrobiota bacterium]
MYEPEIARRRTFAIISHPDAGKTTLTEKFLLYGGAVQEAGSVTARKNQRESSSDWMELERKRGISVNSTLLQFPYGGYQVNLLDTPGHKDFSEDTYRVLMAVDSVVMVLDAAKGIESQTLKLFEICRMRGIPIFTFINKLDRPAKEPLELLDEVESTLQLHTYAMNFPLGAGADFKGVYERAPKRLHLFERVPGGAFRAPVTVIDRVDGTVSGLMDPRAAQRVLEDIAVLDAAGAAFDPAALAAGDMTPVFFGSAVNNFGVQLLLDGFLEHAPAPRAQPSVSGPVDPGAPNFSGFVFKIQSNMDPRHRDQLAFVRVCSGRFEREMKVLHHRTGASIRLSSSHKLFGRDRETVDEAYAGDVIGIVGHPELRIGDTLTQDPSVSYPDIPRFTPEHFAYLHGESTLEYKRFRTGLDHLLQEGVVQSFTLLSNPRQPLLAAVGPLQFEVLQHRLETEFGARSRLEECSWKIVRWVEEPPGLGDARLLGDAAAARDPLGRLVLLFSKDWDRSYFEEKNPAVKLSKHPTKA